MRRQMLERRNSLATGQVEEQSRLVQGHVIASKEFAHAKVIGAYHAAGSEVRTSMIIDTAVKQGKKVALPRTEGDRMVFYELAGGLVEGKFGIMEPRPTTPVDGIDLIIVPGVAFDLKGCRVGYGKGYYDRFLSMQHSFSMGLAYSFQILDELPRGRFDRRIAAVATESGISYL
ncbi:MAG: 5-formyltetrahydrofolate cyclo-ligase [Nitrososphaera sp.]